MNTPNEYQMALGRVLNASQKNEISEATTRHCELYIESHDYFDNVLGSVDRGTSKKTVSLYDMKSKALGHFQTFIGLSAIVFYIIYVLRLIIGLWSQ